MLNPNGNETTHSRFNFFLISYLCFQRQKIGIPFCIEPNGSFPGTVPDFRGCFKPSPPFFLPLQVFSYFLRDFMLNRNKKPAARPEYCQTSAVNSYFIFPFTISAIIIK
jgi:hypothetical protein